jgi:hypothetical protein
VGLDVGLETRWSEQMLSDAKARQIAPGGKSLAAGMVPGLYLRPSSARGQGSWFLRFVMHRLGRLAECPVCRDCTSFSCLNASCLDGIAAIGDSTAGLHRQLAGLRDAFGVEHPVRCRELA